MCLKNAESSLWLRCVFSRTIEPPITLAMFLDLITHSPASNKHFSEQHAAKPQTSLTLICAGVPGTSSKIVLLRSLSDTAASQVYRMDSLGNKKNQKVTGINQCGLMWITLRFNLGNFRFAYVS